MVILKKKKKKQNYIQGRRTGNVLALCWQAVSLLESSNCLLAGNGPDAGGGGFRSNTAQWESMGVQRLERKACKETLAVDLPKRTGAEGRQPSPRQRRGKAQINSSVSEVQFQERSGVGSSQAELGCEWRAKTFLPGQFERQKGCGLAGPSSTGPQVLASSTQMVTSRCSERETSLARRIPPPRLLLDAVAASEPGGQPLWLGALGASCVPFFCRMTGSVSDTSCSSSLSRAPAPCGL